MKWNPGGDTSQGGGKFLREGDDGWHHVVITAAREGAVKSDGNPINNAMAQIECEVIASTVPTAVGKAWENTFFQPKLNGKDGGAFTKKVFDRFLMATSMATQEQLDNPESELDINMESMVGRQFIVKLATEDGDNNKKYLRIAYADIFHVDDPAVKDQPKNEQYLKPDFFPPEWRWDPAKKAAAAAPKAPTPPAKPTQTGFI